MKFGRHLSRNQVPEWATHYIKYKSLKKRIKGVAETARQGGAPDTTGKPQRLDAVAGNMKLTMQNSSIP